ncbi:cytosolic sulfotransferase 12-like [Salvia miltiorrhiza]|uniref:cytosolic sulfotransferase 12-like n=1 Tax=Salvia miltiorrhiza TaxID=226208 RepID=UPI0025AC7EBC|nr:cytosolic sulfotransferase 12-like [Salvia miltiorrhiza]
MSSSSNFFKSPQLSQDFKEFLSTLPKENGLEKDPLYLYQGFWYLDVFLEGAISIQQHFQAEDSDVFVASTPKCGSTWLKAIAFALLNRRRHPTQGRSQAPGMIRQTPDSVPDPTASGDHPLLSTNPHNLVPFLEIGLYGGNKALDIASFPSPRLLATHVPYSSLPKSIRSSGSKCKILYVARNPKDAFVSMWHFLAKARKLDLTMAEAFELFCEGLSVYGPFWDHVLEYWKQSLENPERVLFLKYEDMKARPAVEVRRVAEFLGCPFSAEEEEAGEVDRILELCSFEGLRGLEVNKKGKVTVTGVDNSAFFRRGEVGDWKNHLSAEMAKRIDRIVEEKFSGSGLFL